MSMVEGIFFVAGLLTLIRVILVPAQCESMFNP